MWTLFDEPRSVADVSNGSCARQPAVAVTYSTRRARTGSRLAARRAGNSPAINMMVTRIVATDARVTGSRGGSPNRNVDTVPAADRAARTPRPLPTADTTS